MFQLSYIFVQLVAFVFSTSFVNADDTWLHITARPQPTVESICLQLDHFQHLYNLKGLDACEPHHIVWYHLNELTKINWQCRKNIIDILSYRYGQGGVISQFCGCKYHDWTENSASRASTSQQKRTMVGVASECFSYSGCKQLKDLYENDNCSVHENVWNSLDNCPSDIYVEGAPIECQAPIVRQMTAVFNGTYEQYRNDRCVCYPSFGLSNVPSECNNYMGFRKLQMYGISPQNCHTHFDVWKNLATQPVACQNWIIKFLLDKVTDDFVCDCHTTSQDVFGRSVRKRDTSIFPGCEQDSPGWKVLHSTLRTDVCHSHWYIWRHLENTHGTCRVYLINEMFATFAMSTSNCQCDYRQLQANSSINAGQETTTTQATTTILPTTSTTMEITTNPPHACYTCNGTSCASTGSSIPCSNGDDLCMTSIMDIQDGDLVRVIERKCVSKQVCTTQDKSKDSFCNMLTQGSLGFPMTCRFCCVGRNCNSPPGLLPPVSSLYSTHFP